MSKVQLPGSVRFDSQIKMHTGTEKKDVSLAKELKDHLEGEYRKNGVISGISEPGHGKEVDDGLNTVDKCYIYIN